jgi:hypothetical protein
MSFRKKLVSVLVTLGIVGAAGTAFALWSANATGSGSAKALTAQTVTVNAATASADLYPGFTGGDLTFTLTNNNPYPVTFTAMTAGTVTSLSPVACPASNLTVNNATGLSLVAPANSTTASLTIADVATLASGALDGCQGVGFTVALTLSGSQN